MDRKTFTQQLSLRLITEVIRNNVGGYPSIEEENDIVTNIQRLVNKLYKKCKLEDEDENMNKIERYNTLNEYLQ